MPPDRKSRWSDPFTAPPSADDAAAAGSDAKEKISTQVEAEVDTAVDVKPSIGSQANDSLSHRKDGETQHDGDFTRDIEINDLRNRYMLTKSQTQNEIHEETGASVTTKGLWYPDKSKATTADPPLFLHISAMSQESLDRAVEKVNDVINSELPQLIEDRQGRRSEYDQRRSIESAGPSRNTPMEEKVPIGVTTLRNFNVRAKVVGPQGLFVKYIQNETSTKVQIKGFGSGFVEVNSGGEAPEPMFISIMGTDSERLAEAKELAEDLVDAVKTEHEKAYNVLMQHQQQQQQQRPPPLHDQNHPPAMYNRDQQQGAGAGAGAGAWHRGSNAGSHFPDQQQQRRSPLPPAATAAAVPRRKTAEEEAMEKYWREYIDWEKSFRAYHSRLPTMEEGLQQVPREYR